jgi:hypothetical protein
MRRLFILLVGLVLAITAGTLFMAVAGLVVPATRELAADISLGPLLLSLMGMAHGDSPDRVWSMVALTFWVLAVAILVVPTLVTAVVGEFGRWRSFAYYGAVTGALATAIAFLGHPAGERPDGAEIKVMLLVFLTGAVSGLVYWAVAGRSAGLRPDDAEAARP